VTFTIGEGRELGALTAEETSAEPDNPKKEVWKSPESRRESRFRIGQGIRRSNSF